MKFSVTITKAFGIPIRIHYTFFLLLLFIGFAAPGSVYAGFHGVILVSWVFLCVVLHELGHSLVAMKFGIKVESITLLPIGGVASMKSVPQSPKAELLISAAGPAVSLLLAGLFITVTHYMYPPEIWSLLGRGDVVLPMTLELALINVILTIFNLLPAFPMDGGRILRALIWYRKDFLRATVIASKIGQGFAVIMFIAALLAPRIFLALIAVFVYLGAKAERQSELFQSRFSSLRVGDILPLPIVSVPPNASIREARDMNTDNLIVAENHKPLGILRKRDIVRAGRMNRLDAPVSDFMRSQLHYCSPSDSLSDVIRGMMERNIPCVAVMVDGNIVGVVTHQLIWERSKRQ